MTTTRISVFPVGGALLFPRMHLPLHIFESRYREMVHDALNADRLIGIVLLRKGWEREADVNPLIYPTGCAGLITHVERLADGRYNIVLLGLLRCPPDCLLSPSQTRATSRRLRGCASSSITRSSSRRSAPMLATRSYSPRCAPTVF